MVKCKAGLSHHLVVRGVLDEVIMIGYEAGLSHTDDEEHHHHPGCHGLCCWKGMGD